MTVDNNKKKEKKRFVIDHFHCCLSLHYNNYIFFNKQ